MKFLASVVFVAACTYSNPPPQYAQPQPPQQQPGQGAQAGMQPGGAQASAATQGGQPAEPAQPAQPAQPAPPAEPLPIPPDKDMPDHSLTTDAKLALGTEATVTIDSRSDIFSSGLAKADAQRGGVMPSTITLAPGGGIVSFPKVVGRASCNGPDGVDADGGGCAGGNTDLQPANKLSGMIHHERTMFLVGVFLGPKPSAKAPKTLDFSDKALGTKFEKLEPQLGQVFFIGDGHPGDSGGATHDFVVPKGATRLFLGYADGFGFQGTPGAYGDNKGGLAVTVLQRK